MKKISCRLLDLGVVNPYENVAITEVLLKARRMKLIPNTLCIRLPERYVEVGPRVNLRRVNIEYCNKEGIPIIREMGLGNTVAIYDRDTFLYDLVSDSHNETQFYDGIIKSLLLMDLEAHRRPNSNDILVKGKKISGTSHSSRYIPHSCGSLFIDFNYDFCEKAIMPTPQLFANKEAKSHREWVTTLRAQLGREVSYSEGASALRRGFEDVLQVEFEETKSFTKDEKQIFEDLLIKYRSDEWLKYGKWSPVKDYWRPE